MENKPEEIQNAVVVDAQFESIDEVLKQEIAEIPEPDSKAIITANPRITEQEKEFLQTLITSKVLPPHIRNWQTAFAIQQYGKEFGFATMQSFHQIIMIGGVMSLKSSAAAALLQRAKVKVRLIRDFEFLYEDGYSYDKIPDKKPLNRHTEIEFERDGVKQIVKYSYQDAENAELIDKDNWKKHRREMAYWRCLAKGTRRIAPDILMGLYFDFELGATPSYDSYQEVRDIEEK